MPAQASGLIAPMFRTALLITCFAVLSACVGGPLSGDKDRGGALLRDSLTVAEAALAVNQPEVARRLYSSLNERFDEAPEPLLGLGHISFDAKEFTAAERFFVQAAERAEDDPAMRAEALLGVARTTLATGRPNAARAEFQHAREAGRDLVWAAWAANGLAIIAAIDGDFNAAEAHYAEALRLSAGNPRISANFLRMLVAAGMADRAAEIYSQHDPSYWLDGDGIALSRLIDEAHGLAGARAQDASSAPAPGAGAEPHRPERSRPAPMAEKSDVRHSGWQAPKVLTLTLGHSRRLWLNGDATGVLVAAPEIADVQLLSPQVLYIIGKSVGRTAVAVLGEDKGVRDWILSVVLDIEPVRKVLARDPELSGVQARRAGRGIALTGEVASAAVSQRALRLAAGALPKDTPVENELRVTGAQQVNLEVQIAEVQRSVGEDLGINWEAFRIRGDGAFGVRIGRPVPAQSGVNFPEAVRNVRTAIDGEVSPGLFFNRTTATSRFAGMIDALAKAGLANILARPNITATSGEAASFFSGGEFPLPTGFDDGVLVFEYKKYGVLLDFVPTVIDSGRIVLKVRPEVSEPSLNQAVNVVVGVNVPVINVRRAETTVEVGDGESIVIAGLFRNASNAREAGVPGLKDIPGLGALFGQRSVRSEELELIVIVTARLVSPGSSVAAAKASPPNVNGYYY